jgi:NADPH:quinone reductase-like Zn-dependent oxidoreductase
VTISHLLFLLSIARQAMEQDRTAQQEEQLVEAPSTAPNPAEQEGAETQSGGPSSPSVPPTMLAAIYHRYGSPKEIELNSEHPRPRIVRKTDVLIRVHATSINPIDWKMMAGKLSIAQFGKIFPFVPCFDVSGVVAEVGASCKRIKKDDEVWAMSPITCGAAAEYVVLPEKNVALKPESLSHTEAASVPLVGQTSYQALVEYAKIKEGQKVLILGGSGGTGSIAVQLAKHYKCEVITTCSERNANLVRVLGADRVIDYQKESWWEVLKEENVDIVYDTMGGPGVWDHALQVLKKDGTFVTIAGDGGEALTVGRLLSIGATIMNRKFWSVFGSPRFHLITTSPNWTDLFDLRKLFDENHALRPVVERVYPLQQARAAFEEHMKGRTRGKIVIQVVPDDQVQVPSSCFAAAAAAAAASLSSSQASGDGEENQDSSDQNAEEKSQPADATEEAEGQDDGDASGDGEENQDSSDQNAEEKSQPADAAEEAKGQDYGEALEADAEE